MDKIEDEKKYFKIKKSNEQLSTLINKVLSDLKQTKLQNVDEKEKNSVLLTKNECLSSEVTQLRKELEEKEKTINDLQHKLEYLHTYSKAVEGVAENYCGQNISTQNKYNKLKRQSTLILSKLGDNTDLLDIDIVDIVDCKMVCETPTPVLEMAEVRKNHNQIMEQERQRYENLRLEYNTTKGEISQLQNQIEELKVVLKDKDFEMESCHNELDILVKSYETLKEDHDKMFSLFTPYLKMKAENSDLKRTSALLMNNISLENRTLEFLKITEELKEEIIQRDKRVIELEAKCEANSGSHLIVELSAIKTELIDLTEKIAVLTKEKDTLKHENRILKEQKGGFGIPPPPPPPPPCAPPAPPPPPKSKIMNMFKKKGKVTGSESTTKDKPEDTLVFDLMRELERKLLEKVKNKLKAENMQPESPLSPKSFDSPDSPLSPTGAVKLRSRSVPNVVVQNQSNEKTELLRKFAKFNVIPIEEN